MPQNETPHHVLDHGNQDIINPDYARGRSDGMRGEAFNVSRPC